MRKSKFKIKDALATKPGKYYLARKSGKNKTESALSAGYADGLHTSKIEQTEAFQAIQSHYKDELLGQITMKEIAEAHADNIRQDTDRGARNKAIEMAIGKIEPEKIALDDVDKVLVILRERPPKIEE